MAEILNTYIEAVVLVICLCVGYIMKHFVPTEKVNRYIPVTVAVLGIVISVWNSGWVLSPGTIVVGLVSGLASTGMHQALHQIINR